MFLCAPLVSHSEQISDRLYSYFELCNRRELKHVSESIVHQHRARICEQLNQSNQHHHNHENEGASQLIAQLPRLCRYQSAARVNVFLQALRQQLRGGEKRRLHLL